MRVVSWENEMEVLRRCNTDHPFVPSSIEEGKLRPVRRLLAEATGVVLRALAASYVFLCAE